MSGALLVLAATLVFVAAQGGAIFATAFLALRFLQADQPAARLPAMLVSYAAWVLATVIGYMMLGGEGGLMDGFGMVLMLCFTALISTFVYSAVWALAPVFNRDATND